MSQKQILIEQTKDGEQISLQKSLTSGENQIIYIFALGTQNGVDLNISLDEANSKLEVYCLYIVDKDNQPAFNLEVVHNAPNCQSNILYKGVLISPKSRVFWDSNVIINQAARGTQTYEANKNMILAKGARAYSVPNLEILQGDILGAGHASAIGRFDEEQLFYLMSRGLSATQAKQVLVEGFALEVLDNFADKDKRISLDKQIIALLK
ncbi:MAG: SufD family Fe-S cluster assembly protein [Bifidobacteriaceae bacterium]|nr:SufD family Fe-S cluster assembly protein [Bifidobacteriaceae bacterium]